MSEVSFSTVRKQIDEVIFQTYDIRAVADILLPDAVVFYMGKAYATFLRRLNHIPSRKLWVVVGGGIRLSTERIRRPLIGGIVSAGVNVFDAGITSTPELYFAIPYLGADGGINITASHNEAEYNGLKQVVRSQDGFITSINAEEMLEIKRTALEGDFLEGEGECVKLEEREISKYHNLLVKSNIRLSRDNWVYLLECWHQKGLKRLLDTLSSLEFPEGMDAESWKRLQDALGLPDGAEQPETAVRYPLRNLKVVIDFGNGSAWRTKEIYTDLGAEVIALNERPDGSFPSHVPDPIKEKNREELVKVVLREARREEQRSREASGYGKQDVVGFGFDEDGDRVIYIRSDGRVVEGDRTLAIQAKSIIEDYHRQDEKGRPRFIGEVKFSKVVEEFITDLGGEYILTPTGFAFIKDAVKTVYRAIRNNSSSVKISGKEIDLTRNRETVALAAEMSGHQMAGHEENWIFDDGPLAAAKVLTVITRAAKRGRTFIELDEEVPRYPVSPEINIKLPTNLLHEKEELVQKVLDIFWERGYPIDTIDGGLIKWLDEEKNWLGQALVRKSNTQPMLICRVEGRDEEANTNIEKELFGALSQVSTGAVPRLDLTSDDYVKAALTKS